jgi:hypothetical protein
MKPTDIISKAYSDIQVGIKPTKESLLIAEKLFAKAMTTKKSALLSTESLKIKKSNKLGKELNVILYLAPHKLSGYNTCPMASPGCIAACLNLSGNGFYTAVQQSRINKTKVFFENRELFAVKLYKDLVTYTQKAMAGKMKLAVRLNGTSDIQWEVIYPWLFSMFPAVKFYDYTKIDKRFAKPLPANYHLTFSRSETNEGKIEWVAGQNANVAVVFSDLDKAIKTKYRGLRVIDGVSTDRRFADKKGVIVGLQAIAKAKKDATGFVVNNK